MFGLSIISTKRLKEYIENNEKLAIENLGYLEDYSNLLEKYNSLRDQYKSLQTLSTSYELKIACLEKQKSLFYNIGKITMVPNEDSTCLYYKSKYEDELESLKQKCLHLHEILERHHLEE